MVPDGWREGRVNDLITRLESGVSVNGEDRPLNPGELGVLRVSAVTYGTFDPGAVKAIVPSDIGRAKCNPRAGQIIVSRSNTEDLVGASAYIERDYPNLYLSDKLWQTVPKPMVDMKWLSYVLASERSRHLLSNLATGTSGSMKNITKDELLTMKVLIPPASVQKKIAQILSTWDDAIDANEQLLANSRLRKKALMQQLLTGKKRLPGFEGEWKLKPIGKLFSERNETGADHMPLIGIGEAGVYLASDSGRKDNSSSDKGKYKVIYPGDIGYNTMRMWQGRCGLSSLKGIVSPAYTVITPKESSDGIFFYYLFKTPEYIHKFYSRSQGLVSDTWNLKYKEFSKILVLCPSIDEQKAISTVLQTADEEIEALVKRINNLKLQKKALMQQLLTGKKRVTVEPVAA